MVLALIYAGLGRKEDALREGNRAVEILPETKDALNGPILKISLARIHTFVGNHDEAISLLERSLSTIGGATVSELKFDPTWDALRQHPRFQKLVGQEPAAGR
jgi:serine/threonine-protein kinase